ncbi:glycosyltransferase family 2 protein [Candidatus Daviesbacteria bacterium]|nr:glycosyltransferase family 2 protein [Candidatus Daviesbacteria bacterium]
MSKDGSQISVIVTRYSETLEIVKACLNSLSKQTTCKVNVFFLDQMVSEETKKYVNHFKNKRISFEYINIPVKSLSYARNYGLKKAPTKYVAFCDVDCILEKNWCKEIVNTFRKLHPAIVGTKVLPSWERKTDWYHKQRIIQEFYSLIDLSNDYCDLPKVIGASFAVDKSRFNKDIHFNEKLGRQKGLLLGGEETEFCQKVKDSGGKIVYTPYTHANHQISSDRMERSWLQKRAFYGGLSRAIRGGRIEPFNKKKTFLDKIATLLILPFYLSGYFKGKFFKI